VPLPGLPARRTPSSGFLMIPHARVLRTEKCVESIILIIQVYVTEQREQWAHMLMALLCCAVAAEKHQEQQ
jgi:hypothetical protein